jgi:hypothetical protein
MFFLSFAIIVTAQGYILVLIVFSNVSAIRGGSPATADCVSATTFADCSVAGGLCVYNLDSNRSNEAAR